jgi:hypothetical protein
MSCEWKLDKKLLGYMVWNLSSYFKGSGCVTEAVFCYTGENSHHLEAQVT